MNEFVIKSYRATLRIQHYERNRVIVLQFHVMPLLRHQGKLRCYLSN